MKTKNNVWWLLPLIVALAPLLSGCAGFHLSNLVPHFGGGTAPVPPAAPPGDVAGVFMKLVYVAWAVGIPIIALGAFFIYIGVTTGLMSKVWLGVEVIGITVGGLVLATWVATHYVQVIIVCVIAAVAWVIVKHQKQAAMILDQAATPLKAELAAVEGRIKDAVK